MSLGNIEGNLESGYIDFTGETLKTVTLATTTQPGKINLFVYENQGFGSIDPNPDIPVRNVGNIQVSAHWVDGQPNQFNISTSAEFYGRVIWFIITK